MSASHESFTRDVRPGMFNILCHLNSRFQQQRLSCSWFICNKQCRSVSRSLCYDNPLCYYSMVIWLSSLFNFGCCYWKLNVLNALTLYWQLNAKQGVIVLLSCEKIVINKHLSVSSTNNQNISLKTYVSLHF